MKTRILALIAACGLAASAPAFVTIKPKEAAKPQAAVAKADIQDLVFRAEEGLYKVRLHISVNGKSPTANWTAFVDKAFDYFDRNSDKSLDAKEAAKLVPPSAFQQGINFIFNGRQQAPRVNDLDANKDGKIDRQEFQAHVRRGGLAALQVNVQPPNAQAEQLTSALFKQVVGSRAHLALADMAAAWGRLQKLDQDEDEIVTNQELLQRTYNPFYAQQVEFSEVYYGGGPGRMQPATAFISLTPGEPANVAAAKVLQALQQSKQTYLVPAGPRLSPKAPAFVSQPLRELDLALLTAWLEQPPDLELTVALGNISEGVGRVFGRGNNGGVQLKATGRGTALEKVTAVGADGRLRLTTPGEMVEFVRGGGNFGDQFQYYRQQFKNEADTKQYMDKAQLQQSGQLQFLVNIFDPADRDGDGKLFVKEFNAFLDLLAAGSTSQVNLQVVDQGRGLFDLIDVNHDLRLSRREFLDATKKFSEFDRDSNSKLERAELPRQLRMTIGQGANGGFYSGVVFDASGMMVPLGQGSSTKGPAWFRKMDRNKDGDVSPREFLGLPEEFKKLDADTDGLVSAAEAEKFQKEIQTQNPKK